MALTVTGSAPTVVRPPPPGWAAAVGVGESRGERRGAEGACRKNTERKRTTQAISAMTDKDNLTTELRLIPEFDGTNHVVTEWLEKLELVCEVRERKDLAKIVPLRLTAGAFAVYQQLSTEDKSTYEKVKGALLSAFAVDKYNAYEQFVTRKLREGEAVDVYLADLRRLATLFGGMTEDGVGCAFIAGLPETVRRTLRAGSRMEKMDVSELLTRARAVLVEEDVVFAAAAVTGHQGRAVVPAAPAGLQAAGVFCYSCKQPNHLARDCLAGYGGRGRGGRSGGGRGGGARGSIRRCFFCNRSGHLIAQCPENDAGEAVSAPASSPTHQ